MHCNLGPLERKYKQVEQQGDTLVITVRPSDYPLDIYLDDGVWQINPRLIGNIQLDVLNALGLEDGSKEALQLKRRLVVNVDGSILIEFKHA